MSIAASTTVPKAAMEYLVKDITLFTDSFDPIVPNLNRILTILLSSVFGLVELVRNGRYFKGSQDKKVAHH